MIKLVCQYVQPFARPVAALILMMLLGLAASAAVASELDDMAQRAFDEEQDPGLVTRQLISQGYAAPRVAEAISRVWNDCAATQAAVAVAVLDDPASAPAIVTAVGTGGVCPCDADGSWARSRLDARVRLDRGQRAVLLSDACSCLAAATEAAVAALPERADHIVLAGLDALQQETITVDSIGTRGAISDTWPRPQRLGQGRGFRRNPAVCVGDRNESDQFDPQQQWTLFEPGQAAGRPGGQQCDEDQAELLISEFVTDPNGAVYVQLHNLTDEPIDLAALGYRLGVSYPEQRELNVIIPLTGRIEAADSYLLAARDSPLVQQADQITDHLVLLSGDALSLHRPATVESCDCVEGLVAGALRGAQSRLTEEQPLSAAQHKLTRLAGTNPYANGLVVDAVGQAPSEEPVAMLAAAGARQPGWCESDPYELDTFQFGANWRQSDANDLSRCAQPVTDMLIGAYQLSGQGKDRVTLLNGSNQAIDLDSGRYILEIYRHDESAPEQTIALSGQVPPGQPFLLVDRQAAKSWRDQADVLVDSVDLTDASAIVLARRDLQRPLHCLDPLLAILQGPLDGPFLLIDVATIEGRQRPGEPPRLDPPASPN